MLDTIRIYWTSEEFQILDDNRLVIQPGNTDSKGIPLSSKVLWKDSEGKSVIGEKAFFNNHDTGYSIDIQKLNSHEKSYLFLNFSAPKIYYGNNFQEIEINLFIAVLEKLKTELKKDGIIIDLQKAKISRLDIFRNVMLEKDTTKYMPIIHSLNINRTISKNYENGLLLHNKNFSVNIYDKIREMESKKQVIPQDLKNILRFEFQLKNNKTVFNLLGISLLSDLINNFDVIQTFFRNFINKLFCNLKNDNFENDPKNLEQIFCSALENENKNWLKDTFTLLGIQLILEKYGYKKLHELILSVASSDVRNFS